MATLQRTLLPFEKLNRELESLEKLYNEGKKLYEKAFSSLDQSIFSLPKYEEFNSATPTFLGAIQLFKDTLQEKGKSLSRSKALSPYRQVIAIDMVNQLSNFMGQIGDLLKTASTNKKIRQIVFETVVDQLKHMKEKAGSIPELACLAAWLDKSPFFSENEIENEKITEWLKAYPLSQIQSIENTCTENYKNPVFADFMKKTLFKDKISYPAALCVTLSVSFLISTLQFNGISSFLAPFLQICYPAFIVLTLLNILHKLYGFKPVKLMFYATIGVSLATYLI